MPIKYNFVSRSVFAVMPSTWKCTLIPAKPMIAETSIRRIFIERADDITACSPVEISRRPKRNRENSESGKSGFSDAVITEKSTVKPHTSKILFIEFDTAFFIISESGFAQ